MAMATGSGARGMGKRRGAWALVLGALGLCLGLSGCQSAGLSAYRAEMALRERFEPIAPEWELSAPAYGIERTRVLAGSPVQRGALLEREVSVCWLSAPPAGPSQENPCLSEKAVSAGDRGGPLRAGAMIYAVPKLPARYLAVSRQSVFAGPYASEFRFERRPGQRASALFDMGEALGSRRLANARLILDLGERDARLSYQAPDLSRSRMADLGEAPRYARLPAEPLETRPLSP